MQERRGMQGPLFLPSPPPCAPTDVMLALGQAERRDPLSGKKGEVLQNPAGGGGQRESLRLLGWFTSSPLPGWVARAMVGVDQTLASDINTNQKIIQKKPLPPLAHWLSFTCSHSYSFQSD